MTVIVYVQVQPPNLAVTVHYGRMLVYNSEPMHPRTLKLKVQHQALFPYFLTRSRRRLTAPDR